METDLPKRSPAWTLLVVVGVLVTLVASYLVVRDIHWGEVGDALRDSNLWWLGPSFVVLALGVFLRAVRWRVLFPRESRPSVLASFEALLVGYFFNNVLPARVGEAARVVALHRRAGTSRAEALGTVIVVRVYDVASLLILLFAAVPWFPEVSWLRAAGVLALVVGAGLTALIVLLAVFREGVLIFLLRPLRRLPFVGADVPERVARNATQGLFALRGARSAIAPLVWTTASWLVIAFSFWLLMLGFHLGLSPAAGLLVTIAIGLAMILPSSPGALGVFEGATVVALGAYDISDERALSFALMLHMLNLLPFIAAGPWALHATAVGSRRRRSMETRATADASG